MAEPSRSAAVLRVGIIESGTLTQERLLPLDAPVTLGTSGTNTLVVGTGPASMPLFDLRPDGLRLHPDLQARARMKRGHADVVLTFGVRGRIQIDGVHVLYQLVSAPVVAALPTSFDFRAPWIEEGDPALLPSFAAWSALALLLAVYVSNAPRPVNVTTLDLLPQRTQQITFAAPPSPAPELTVSEKIAVVKEVVHVNAPEQEEATDTIRTPGQRAAEKKASLEAMELRAAKLIGNLGDTEWFVDNDDAMAMDDLAETKSGVGEDLDGPRIARGDPLGEARIAQAHVGGGTGDGIGGGPEVNVFQRPDLKEMEPESDIVKVSRTLKRYLGQVKGCYERALKKDGRIGGRMELGLALDEGTVTSVWMIQSLGVSELDACIQKRAAMWEFDASASGDVHWPIVLRPR